MPLYADWKHLAEVCSYDIVLENLIFKWNMISSFAGLSGGFIFFIIVQPNGTLNPTTVNASTASQISQFLLITSFGLCYCAVSVSLALSSVFSNFLMHNKEQTKEFQEVRLKSLNTCFDKFQWMFDLPMTLSVVSIFCILASLVFIVMNQGETWLWIYACSLFTVLISVGFVSAMRLNLHMQAWVVDAIKSKPL